MRAATAVIVLGGVAALLLLSLSGGGKGGGASSSDDALMTEARAAIAYVRQHPEMRPQLAVMAAQARAAGRPDVAAVLEAG